jgi:uncharacterized membrane protein YfcA
VSVWDYLFAAAGGFLAGGVNALAGGGTLLSFPILVAIGLPPVSANVTNTVALSPGYLGGALSQQALLGDQRHRIRSLSVAAALGGLVGSIVLLLTSDEAFRNLVPVLLLVATLLLAGQDRIRSILRLQPAGAVASEAADPTWLPFPVFLVSLYGGYFGAGLGIMLLAVLGLALHDVLPRLNALKQVLALVINGTAAVFFLFSGKVYWVVGLVMAVTSLLGGSVGGRLAGAVQPARLRLVVVVIGLSVSVAYAVKTYG